MKNQSPEVQLIFETREEAFNYFQDNIYKPEPNNELDTIEQIIDDNLKKEAQWLSENKVIIKSEI
jgi:hypothetical protein